ncbi:hypothetical protein V6Z11_A01G068800 [Gossypium hirsutum]
MVGGSLYSADIWVLVTGLDLLSHDLCGLRRSVRPNSPKSTFTQVMIPLEVLQSTNLQSESDLCQKKLIKNNKKSAHKFTISTSILSKRWRFLWILVPILDFRQTTSYYTDKKSRTSFRHLAYKALMLNKAASLHKFRLTCNIDLGLLFLNTMINGVILPNVVREVDISIFAKWRFDFFELPTCLFSAENLSVRLLSLKVLHLKSVTYANNKSVSKLLQGRTMLEELIVKITFKDNARNFIFHVSTLKTLNIKVQFDKMSKLRSQYDLTINTPNLYVFVSLVEANVCYYGTGLFRMVEALCNAKFLHLKWTHYCDFRARICFINMINEWALRKDEAFPLFPNLTQLELNFGFDGRNLTPYFLENSHALEVLVLRPDTRTRIKDPESLPPQLREVYVRGFSGLHHELEMVEYLLKNSRALELIEISHYRLHRQSMSSVLLKLSKFPRRSHACKVAFI